MKLFFFTFSKEKQDISQMKIKLPNDNSFYKTVNKKHFVFQLLIKNGKKFTAPKKKWFQF
jgi:hypothetical protein